MQMEKYYRDIEIRIWKFSSPDGGSHKTGSMVPQTFLGDLPHFIFQAIDKVLKKRKVFFYVYLGQVTLSKGQKCPEKKVSFKDKALKG